MSKKQYEIFVADDKGWLDGCQDTCETFFGTHNTKAGEWTYTMDGGFLAVVGYRNARRVLRELNTTGDWVAPEEVNPEGLESRPVSGIRARKISAALEESDKREESAHELAEQNETGAMRCPPRE